MISYGKFRRHLERNVEYSNSFSVNEYKATVWNMFKMYDIKEGSITEVLISV